MNEILEMSREINYNNLVYEFEDIKISSISFIGFEAPMYNYDKIKKR